MPQGASLPVPIQGWGSGQTAQINFKDIAEEGPVELFKLKFLFSLLSTGAAFALSIDTGINAGSEGGDDADVLLATLLTNWVADLTQDEQTFSETGVQVRTLLGLLNTRDFAGSFMVNPVNVPVSTGSAQQYSLEINVPVALDQYVPWGGISTLGTQYLRNGFMQLSAGNLGATLAFAHGNAVLSAVTPSCEAALGVGESGDCGLRWVARRTSATLQFEPERFDMPLFFGSTSAPAASSTETYTWAFNRQQVDPLFLQDEFRRRRGQDAQFYDVSNRITPIDFRGIRESFFDQVATKTQRNSISVVNPNSSTLPYLQVGLRAAGPIALSRVSRAIGNGGPTHTRRRAPHGVPPGMRVPEILASALPVRVRPGVGPTNTRAVKNQSTPRQAATMRAVELAKNERQAAGVQWVLRH